MGRDITIKIFCLYFEGKYSTKYVDNLYDGLKRFSKKPFEFICYSDTDNIKADRIIKLPKDTPIKEHWFKINFFNPLFCNQQPNDQIIVMDIDQVIVSDITEMLEYPVQDNELITYKNWWLYPSEKLLGKKSKDTKIIKINGGWYKFKAGNFKYIWDEFYSDIEKWQLYFYNNSIVHYKYFGEQNFVEKMLEWKENKITHMPAEWVGRYTQDKILNRKTNIIYSELFNEDYMILDIPNPKIKIIHFASPNSTVHDCKESWLKEYWK